MDKPGKPYRLCPEEQFHDAMENSNKAQAKAQCAICQSPLKDFFGNYPSPVCHGCDQKAVNVHGEKPEFDSFDDSGQNPVFIDGKRCWRRYRFGGYITMLDRYDCKDLSEFYERTGFLTRKREKVAERTFETEFQDWVESVCKDWNYPIPSPEYYRKVYERLPKSIRLLLSQGLLNGTIISQGRRFTLKGLSPKKGSYNWFSRYAKALEPAPNWEYFVQVAEFVRLQPIAASWGLSITFEDDLMDIGIYKGDKLLVCCEVKEKRGQLQELINGIKNHESGMDYSRKDRGNDALQKAKYIAHHKPDYFMGISIGRRLEFRVTYPEGKAFELAEDMIPWLRKGGWSSKGKDGEHPNWKWSEGSVNAEGDHIKIRYGNGPKPVALVAPGKRNSFTVQFLLKPSPPDRKTQKIIREVRRELDFFLVEKNEVDPWAYVIYHCSTAANLYSNVHWGYYSAGYKD